MDDLVDFALREKYSKVSLLRSKLDDMNKVIDWTAFVKLFPDKETTRGRPEYDKVLMIKILCLQSWYTISDEEVEFQITDRLSFQKFLGYPKNIPDYSTIWRFREELIEDDIIDKIWAELHRQITALNLVVKEGKIQDASFIDASPGKTNSGMNDRGREAKTSRSKDGSWTKKSGRSHFGFKLHTKMQKGSKIIEEIAVTSGGRAKEEQKLYGGNPSLCLALKIATPIIQSEETGKIIYECTTGMRDSCRDCKRIMANYIKKEMDEL
jgi:IS5 family transposase